MIDRSTEGSLPVVEVNVSIVELPFARVGLVGRKMRVGAFSTSLSYAGKQLALMLVWKYLLRVYCELPVPAWGFELALVCLKLKHSSYFR